MGMEQIKKTTNEILERVVNKLDRLNVERMNDKDLEFYTKIILKIREDCRSEQLYCLSRDGYGYGFPCSTQSFNEDEEK